MIHFHGGPITPEEVAAKVLAGRHAMVSFAAPQQLILALDICQTVAFDNGAFSFWKSGKAPDWSGYFDWVAEYCLHPTFDFALIPDVIDGTEGQNDDLVSAWHDDGRFKYGVGVPVWHLHESLDRLERLSSTYRLVAIGSSGQYSQIGTHRWWSRMAEAMTACCESEGWPLTKLHGLRMLDPRIFTRFPFASADSTNVARNIGIDGAWRGSYQPANKAGRAIVLADRIEAQQSAALWDPHPPQEEMFAEEAFA